MQLCTASDAWEPGTGDLGRRFLEGSLLVSNAQVKILAKNVAVVDKLDLIEAFRERVTLSLSLTATPARERLVAAIEPNASLVGEWVRALRDARSRGLRGVGLDGLRSCRPGGRPTSHEDTAPRVVKTDW